MILQSLVNGDKAVKEISKEVGITNSIVRAHLKHCNYKNTLALKKAGLVKHNGFTKTKGEIWAITQKGQDFLQKNRYKLDIFLVEGNISKFYLALVKQFQTPFKIAKEINRRNDTVSKILLKLYRNN